MDINECVEQPWVCSQVCENMIGSYACKCADGYEKSSSSLPDSRHCKYTLDGANVKPLLIYSSRYYLRTIALESGDANLIKSGFVKASGTAYDYVEQNVYVFDSGTGELHKIKINASLPNLAVTSEVHTHIRILSTPNE